MKILKILLVFIYLPIFSISTVHIDSDKTEISLGTHLEVLEDKEGKSTLQELKEGETENRWFRNKSEVPNFGASDSVFWLRFKLENNTVEKMNRIIEIRFPPIDYIDFYIIDNNENVSVVRTGDRRVFKSRQHNNRNFLFDISLESNESKLVYIRTWSHDGLHESIPIVIYDQESFTEKSLAKDALLGMYFGILFVMIFYNLFIFLSVKDISYLYYILYLVFFSLWGITFYGYGFMYFWPEHPDFNNKVLPIFCGAFMVMVGLFSKSFLSLSRILPRVDKIISFLTFFLLAMIPLSATLKYSTGWTLIFILSLAMALILIPSGFYGVLRGERSSRYYITAWIFPLIGGLLMVLKIASVLPSNFLTENSLPVGTVIEVILLSLGLADRINELKRLNELTILKNQAELEKVNKELEEKVHQRTLNLENAKSEIETLNEISKKVNSDMNIERIMNFLMQYLEEKYKINLCSVYTVNKSNNNIEAYYLSIPDSSGIQISEFIKNTSFSLNDSTHTHSYVYKNAKPLYTRKLKVSQNAREQEIVNTLRMKSSLIIPLFLQEEVIGFLDFSRTEEELVLSENDIESLTALSAQITGAINNSRLMQRTEQARQESESLNNLIKNINSVSTLTDIMSFIMYYLETEYEYKDFWMILVEKKKKTFKNFSFVSPRLSEEKLRAIKDWNSPIGKEAGLLYESYLKQEAVFYKINDNPSSFEKGIQDLTDWTYFIYLPLLIYGDTVGILSINKPVNAEEISKEEREKLQKFSDQIAGAVFNAELLKEAEKEKEKSEKLLLNILPEEVAIELKEKGAAEPIQFENVSVMFTDFKGFTKIAESMSPQELIKELDGCFSQFDRITERYSLEKLKTIGDSYMCAGGLPNPESAVKSAVNSVLAALEIQSFMNQMKEIKEMLGLPYWELRLGIHSGPLVAGVIGERKFAYDVWGDTVNTASRMESSGTPGKINISGSTFELVKDFFECDYRGKVNAKNKGEVDMYYVTVIRKEFRKEASQNIPNESFWDTYKNL